MLDLLLVLLGIATLYAGGEALVRGSVTLAQATGVSSLAIGLTLVSLATSSPELASTLTAVVGGIPDLAFANIVGSNIANLGLILGLSALLFPLGRVPVLTRREMPFLIATSLILCALIVDDRAGRVEGALLIVLLAMFVAYLVRRERRHPGFGIPTVPATASSLPASLLWIVVGGVGLWLGAGWLIDGAVGLAQALGVSDRVVGLSVVALGTSLPELASSLVAGLKRQHDIVLGNLIGSNIFNILCIMGTTALVRPVEVEPGSVWGDLAAMLAIGLLAWLLMHHRSRLSRWEGLALLAAYATYLVWIFAA